MKTLKSLNHPIETVNDLDLWYMSLTDKDIYHALMINTMANFPNVDYFKETSVGKLLSDEYLEDEELNMSDCITEWLGWEPYQKLVAYCIVCGLINNNDELSNVLNFVSENIESQLTFKTKKELQEMLGLTDLQIMGVLHETLVKRCLEKKEGEI